MEAALVGACEVPLEIMRTCAEAIDLIETFAERAVKLPSAMPVSAPRC